jgi:hypothetical protein
MTQTGTAPAQVKTVVMQPLCSREAARKKWLGHYLERADVEKVLTESIHIKSPEGDTKILFLKGVLPAGIVPKAWDTLQKFHFKPASESRRAALAGSMSGGELLLGWMDMARRSMGTYTAITAETRSQWATFRELWPLLWTIQHFYNKVLPEYAKPQMAQAQLARESPVDYLLRTAGIKSMGSSDSGRVVKSKDDIREELERWEKVFPDTFNQLFLRQLAETNPEYLEKLFEQDADAQQGLKYHHVPGKKDGNVVLGNTVPGTLFSTITINQTVLFRAHEDGNNLDGALSCLAAFGNWINGDLGFPRFGVSCPMEPGDLLIADTNRELHGNLGPIHGERISIVAYMRDALASK